MTLRTSLVIAGDASSAVAALDQTEAGLGQASAKAAQLSAAYANADRAIDQLAAAQVTAKAQTAAAKAAFEAGEISLRDYNARLIETKSALSLVEAGHRTALGEIRKMSVANDTVGPSLAQARAGYVNFGRNVQDVAVQLQSGTNIGTIVAQQGGQIADAVAQMGGRFSGLASFLAGPYGAAVLIAASAGLNLAQSLWTSRDAASENAVSLRQVELASDGLAEAQSVLGKMFDLTSGKLQKQNELLRLNAQLQALNLRIEADAAREKTNSFKQGVGPSAFSSFTAGGFGEAGDISVGREAANAQTRIRNLITQVGGGTLDATQALKAVTERDLKLLNITITEYQQAIADALTGRFKGATAAAIEESLANDQLDPSLRRLDTSKPKKPRKDTSAERAREFGEDAASRIANIGDRFRDLPGPVEKANKALRELDDVASDLQLRKPPGYEKLIEQARGLKPLIEASLLRPFDEYLAKGREAAEIDRLLIAGRDDEAAALKVVLALQDQIGPLNEEQLSTVRATVQAERARALVLRDQRALIDANIRAVHDMRGALEQTVADALRGRFSIGNILNSIANSYINITSQRIVEKLFGDTLRSMEQQATGADKVDEAAGQLSSAMGKGSDAVTRLADAVERAVPRIDNAVAGTPAANDNGAAVPASNDNFAPTGEPADIETIIVEGRRRMGLSGMDAGSLIVDLTSGLLRDLGINIPKEVGDGVKSVLASLEKRLPDVLGGAITGASASRIILGDRGTGGTIGSSVGGILGDKIGEKVLTKGFESIAKGLGSFAGPVGSIVGGLVGGLIGGLFKKAPSAGAVITDTSSAVSVTGNSDASKQAVSTVSGALQSSIKQIAKQLGGELGQFAVSIGQREDYYRVAGVATDAVSAKHPERGTGVSLLYNGTDANAALAAALANAIADGAVKGLSPKVEKALKSSTNLDDALAEALKVQDLELALGGVRGAIEKEFRTFEAAAKDRLRIAKAYGFDLVEVEALNGRERLALSEKLLKEQTGSLQSLIDEITSGSLFEGSAVDRREALLAQIVGARADAEAGKDGAADTLAKLLQDLNTVSKEVYGTTGGFAADQAAILDAARDSIAKANQRIQEAQQAVTQATSDPALAETNQQLDETNDQLAKIAAAMNVSVDYLKAIAANGNGTPDYAALRRMAGY